MKLKSIFCTLLSVAIALVAVPEKTMVSAKGNGGEMRDLSTMELIKDMGIGINLGNTFESCGDWIDQWGDGTPSAYETAWGSPVITKEMIDGYADAGFGVIRVPVAWSNMMADDNSYTINSSYLARVTEVVDWALEDNLYVIVNLHWDSGWLEDLPTNYDTCMQKYTTIWTQVSDAFCDYGYHLIFESQNEELGWSSVWNRWGGDSGKEESFNYVNAVNQAFVDVVRNSDGNNPQRHLLISGYNTDVELTCDPLFQMPEDPAERCAVSVHYYTPAGFAILTQDESWGKAQSTWGTDAEYEELNRNMDMLEERYSSKGIPVIIGEYGCPRENKEEESVRRFLTAVCEASLSRGGICPVLWDTTGLHYDRTTCEMTDAALNSQLVAIRDKYLPQDVQEEILGDVNGDGTFGVADVVLLQKWLHAVPDTKLPKWKMADINEDGILNVIDLALMKQKLLQK